MKIVIINGSPRKNGATAQILKEIDSQLSLKKDVEVQFFHVSDMKLNFCVGCCRCYKEGNCFMNDDIEKLSHIMSESDGIIIGSPTYASDISAQLKTIIDRGHFVIEQLLHRKYAMSLVTYENYGGRDAITNINRVLSYSGAQKSAQILLKLPFSSAPSIDKHFINKKTEKFYHDITHQKSYVFQYLKHNLIFHFGILPFVKQKKDKYNGVIQQWKKRNII